MDHQDFDLYSIRQLLWGIGAEILAMRKKGLVAVSTKFDRFDLQTAADRYAEFAIVEFLEKSRTMSGFAIYGEEGTALNTGSRVRVFIDPIDGTTPFAMGEDNFSISLGFETDGVPDGGFLYFPAKNKLIDALLGKGVFINGIPYLKPSESSRSVFNVLVGFDFSAGANRLAELEKISPVIKEALGIRIAGSFTGAVLEILEGRWGAYVHLGATPYDLGAAVVIMKEAGFCLSTGWSLDEKKSPIIMGETSVVLELINLLGFPS